MPVRSSADAIHLFSLAVHQPYTDETLAFLLDDEGIGGVIIAVAGTVEPDAMLDVVSFMARPGADAAGRRAIVVASVRPGGGLIPGDIDRWFEASDMAETNGCTLVEWYVIGRDGVDIPRELIGEPARW